MDSEYEGIRDQARAGQNGTIVPSDAIGKGYIIPNGPLQKIDANFADWADRRVSKEMMAFLKAFKKEWNLRADEADYELECAQEDLLKQLFEKIEFWETVVQQMNRRNPSTTYQEFP